LDKVIGDWFCSNSGKIGDGEVPCRYYLGSGECVADMKCEYKISATRRKLLTYGMLGTIFNQREKGGI
jgi:hypothetical protein